MRHGIDFCCGGNVPLAEACAKRGLMPEAVLAEIRAEQATGGSEDLVPWDERPLEELIQYIVSVYHASAREELPRLMEMARKVNNAHGAKDPKRLAQLLNVLQKLEREMLDHMDKEQFVLFPMIRAGHGQQAGGPVQVMLSEHDDAAAALECLRSLTNDYTPPKDACTTWRALWASLEAFDRETREHIHLENNVLFPRALGVEAA